MSPRLSPGCPLFTLLYHFTFFTVSAGMVLLCQCGKEQAAHIHPGHHMDCTHSVTQQGTDPSRSCPQGLSLESDALPQ